MSETNGAATGSLAGWVVCQSEGLTLIGRVMSHQPGAPSVVRLGPVFELKPQLIGQGRSIAMGHACFPVWLLPVETLDVPGRAMIYSCGELPEHVQKALFGCVARAQKMFDEMRPPSPIAIVGPGVDLSKLPPIPGERW